MELSSVLFKDYSRLWTVLVLQSSDKLWHIPTAFDSFDFEHLNLALRYQGIICSVFLSTLRSLVQKYGSLFSVLPEPPSFRVQIASPMSEA